MSRTTGLPVATTAGWNHRATAFGGPDGCESSGLLVPFAPDQATRTTIGDPRLSLTERYGTHAAYASAVASAAKPGGKAKASKGKGRAPAVKGEKKPGRPRQGR